MCARTERACIPSAAETSGKPLYTHGNAVRARLHMLPRIYTTLACAWRPYPVPSYMLQ